MQFRLTDPTSMPTMYSFEVDFPISSSSANYHYFLRPKPFFYEDLFYLHTCLLTVIESKGDANLRYGYDISGRRWRGEKINRNALTDNALIYLSFMDSFFRSKYF